MWVLPAMRRVLPGRYLSQFAPLPGATNPGSVVPCRTIYRCACFSALMHCQWFLNSSVHAFLRTASATSRTEWITSWGCSLCVMAAMCVRNVPNAIVVIGVLRSRAIRSARSARLSYVRYHVRRCLLRRWEGPCSVLSLQPTPGEEKDRCHERKGTQHHQHRENRERHGPLPLLLARCQKA